MRWGQPWAERRKKYWHKHGKEWFRWFAWYPVCTRQPYQEYVWLEWVEKRYPQGYVFNNPEYRSIDEIH
ncbi:MAG: hypothetical protein ACXV2C_00185 [Candidatus Bathyarchaeia archaeon]